MYLANDVMFKILNNEVFVADDIFKNVTDGDKAGQMIVFDNGEMADELIRHQLHAVFNFCVRCNKYQAICHNVPD